MSERGVRFGPGTVVSPGEYRNVDTGTVRYFDGQTPLPGGVNASSWQQVSDHYHPRAHRATSASEPDAPPSGVRFAPGTMVSSGTYRNCETGAVRFFDGKTALPGGAQSPAWQQISDHYHSEAHAQRS